MPKEYSTYSEFINTIKEVLDARPFKLARPYLSKHAKNKTQIMSEKLEEARRAGVESAKRRREEAQNRLDEARRSKR